MPALSGNYNKTQVPCPSLRQLSAKSLAVWKTDHQTNKPSNQPTERLGSFTGRKLHFNYFFLFLSILPDIGYVCTLNARVGPLKSSAMLSLFLSLAMLIGWSGSLKDLKAWATRWSKYLCTQFKALYFDKTWPPRRSHRRSTSNVSHNWHTCRHV